MEEVMKCWGQLRQGIERPKKIRTGSGASNRNSYVSLEVIV